MIPSWDEMDSFGGGKMQEGGSLWPRRPKQRMRGWAGLGEDAGEVTRTDDDVGAVDGGMGKGS